MLWTCEWVVVAFHMPEYTVHICVAPAGQSATSLWDVIGLAVPGWRVSSKLKVNVNIQDVARSKKARAADPWHDGGLQEAGREEERFLWKDCKRKMPMAGEGDNTRSSLALVFISIVCRRSPATYCGACSVWSWHWWLGGFFPQRLDPTQFVRVYGRPLRVHLEQSVALAAESPQSMWAAEQCLE